MFPKISTQTEILWVISISRKSVTFKVFKYGIMIKHFNFYKLGLGSSATTCSCDCQAGVKNTQT